MEINKPQQRQQTSRKGKRSWRKNIDLDDIEKGLEERREDLIQHGKSIEDLDSEELFYIDDEADHQITKKLKKNNVKSLKSQEILNQRSKVPALKLERNSRKVQGVDKKEIHRLMKLAGKVQGVDKTKTLVESQGIITTRAYDVWGEADPEDKVEKTAKPEVLVKYSSIGYTPATVAPATLKHKPVVVRNKEVKPHEGKSYNPSFDSWQSLIQQEFFKEKSKEDQRIMLEEHREKIMHLVETLYDNEVETSDDDENENKDSDKEEPTTVKEGEEDDDDAEDKYKLSINPAVKNNQKTQTQRNKQQRHKERTKLEAELKQLKQKVRALEKLPEILAQVEEQPTKTRLTREESDALRVKKETKKLGSKHQAIEAGLEVKLSDELNDSLRKLKPEGNLLYDHMKKLQDSGKIEARKPIKQKKKYSPKISQKWSYKDFKW